MHVRSLFLLIKPIVFFDVLVAVALQANLHLPLNLAISPATI